MSIAGGDVEVSFRRFEEPDAPTVVRLHHAGLEATGAHAGDGPWDDDLNAVQAVYLDSGGEFLVGIVAGAVVAMGALRPLTATVAEIKRMRVEPALQGRGIGRRLLVLLEAAAVERGFERLQLDTTDRMDAALRLYASAGYDEIRRAAGPGPFQMVFMEKALAHPFDTQRELEQHRKGSRT